MKIFKIFYWLFKAVLANFIYGFPSRKLTLIGVTGTDGKTTTTTLIYHLLKTLGKKVDYISSVGAQVGGVTYDTGFHVTTPRFFFLQKMFRASVKSGSHYFVLEVTSHALSQLRTWGCHFHLGVLTNITEEHLDYYRSFADYAQAKMQLINRADIALVNKEPEKFYRYQKLIKNKKIWTTGVNRKADYMYGDVEKLGLDKRFVAFERENILLAYAAGRILGFEPRAIVNALNSFKRVVGRFDYFTKEKKQFLIDFAHTPNAFKQLFTVIKTTLKPKRIIHVFGCAGLRDVFKRPVMGALSGQNSDIIIVTEEDYRTEKLEDIFTAIEKGIRKNPRHVRSSTYFFVENRQEAISKAVSMAARGDLVLLTGKAQEKSLARGKKEYPWDEYEAVDKALSAAV